MKQMLSDGIKELGLTASDGQLDMLITYARMLQEHNERVNLTAITDDAGIVTKHFLDSMTPLCTGKVGRRIIDVGCGAGFPGLVLKIMRPDIELVLLDSLAKRLTFLDEVCERLALSGVHTVHARAEDAARRMREGFDTAVSRAVANMTVLSELCLSCAWAEIFSRSKARSPMRSFPRRSAPSTFSAAGSGIFSPQKSHSPTSHTA